MAVKSIKGGRFEREVSVALSLWISLGKRDDIFWRTAMSGGRATLALKRGGRMNKSQMGDICAVDVAGQPLIDNFIVECKNYKDLNIETGIIHRRGLIYGFWRELYRRARHVAPRQPLLVAHQNNTLPLLITTRLGTEMLGFHAAAPGFALPASDTHRIAVLFSWPAQPEVYLFDALRKSQPNWEITNADDCREVAEPIGRISL